MCVFITFQYKSCFLLHNNEDMITMIYVINESLFCLQSKLCANTGKKVLSASGKFVLVHMEQELNG